MWFLLRSAFWLGLVFTHINWPAGTPAAPDATAIAGLAADRLANVCAANPGPCLQAASRAGRLAALAPKAPASSKSRAAP